MPTDTQWIAIYYFWKLQYEIRHNLISKLNKIRKRIDELRTYAVTEQCELLNNYLESIHIPKGIYFKPLPINNFPCNRYDSKCLSCQNNGKIVSLITKTSRINKMKSIAGKYKFKPHQLILNSSQFIRDILRLIGDRTINDSLNDLYKYYMYEFPVCRRLDRSALDLLGFSDIQLDDDGRLIGTALLQLDLSIPRAELIHRIDYLLNLKYDHTPIYEEISEDFDKIRDNFKYDKEYIINTYTPELKNDFFETRVLGLFYYDLVQSEIFDSFLQLDQAIKRKDWAKYTTKDTIIQNDIDILSLEDITRFLNYIGKGASEYRNLVRYYNTAKSSVEKGEVLKNG